MEAESAHPSLVTLLKRWRAERSRDLQLPSYCILSQETLLLIANSAPATMDELIAIKGFGPKRAEKYGPQLLSLIAEELEEC